MQAPAPHNWSLANGDEAEPWSRCRVRADRGLGAARDLLRELAAGVAGFLLTRASPPERSTRASSGAMAIRLPGTFAAITPSNLRQSAFPAVAALPRP